MTRVGGRKSVGWSGKSREEEKEKGSEVKGRKGKMKGNGVLEKDAERKGGQGRQGRVLGGEGKALYNGINKVTTNELSK